MLKNIISIQLPHGQNLISGSITELYLGHLNRDPSIYIYIYIYIYGNILHMLANCLPNLRNSFVYTDIKNSLSTKTVLHYWSFERSITQWPVDSFHKWPVIRNAFPNYDVTTHGHDASIPMQWNDTMNGTLRFRDYMRFYSNAFFSQLGDSKIIANRQRNFVENHI